MLPPGRPTLLVGAMHAGEIDTVLDQSVKTTADVGLWHLADKAQNRRHSRPTQYYHCLSIYTCAIQNGHARNSPVKRKYRSLNR